MALKYDIPLVSVIIPVYNSESTLDSCILSVIDQDFNNIEIIIIDDGSTDHSKSIAQKYADSDFRIKLITKETNEGLVMARKSGVDNACGKYIQYLDSDDVLRKGALRKLVDKAEETSADIVVAPFYFCTNDKYEKSLFFDFTLLSGIEYIRAMLTWKAHWCVWSKFHLRSLYQNYIDRPKISLGEDVILSVQLFFFAKKIVPIYYEIIDYNLSLGSMSHPDNFNDSKYEDFKGYINWIERFFGNKCLLEVFEKEIAFFHLKNTLMQIHWKKFVDADKELIRVVQDIKKFPELLAILSRRERKIVFVYKYSRWLGYWNLLRYGWQGKI